MGGGPFDAVDVDGDSLDARGRTTAGVGPLDAVDVEVAASTLEAAPLLVSNLSTQSTLMSTHSTLEAAPLLVSVISTQSTLRSTHSALEAAPQLVSVLSAQRPAIMPPFSKVASATEVASCLVLSDLAAKAAQGAVWPIQCRCGTRSGGRRWCPCGRHSCSRLCAPRRARANLAFGRSKAGRRRACRWRHAGSSRTAR